MCGRSEEGFSLPNCLHIDLERDIGHDIYSEEGGLPEGVDEFISQGRRRMMRVVELSFMTGVRPYLASRITPGRLNTYLHMRSAIEYGYLVPDLKREIERPKSLRMLLSLDKGGTIFYPTPGAYSNVAKCDFASMYPNIIVQKNISPEMMGCENCPMPIEVPEAGWRICGEKKGIIPHGIEAVLKRRLELKRKMREAKDPVLRESFNLRQRALKNILVTCFGYLGFSNFVFSNVECKECVMLYGRHILQRTKEIAEGFGLAVHYGIVDSLFVSGGDEKKFGEFAGAVSREVGIELEVDCIFSRVVFPASKDSSGVANKYYGLTGKNEIEARGIAIRHSDACLMVKNFQAKAARLILEGKSVREGYLYAEAELLSHIGKMREGKFPMKEFAIVKPITKPIDEYVSNTPHVVAYRQLPEGNASNFIYSVNGPVPFARARYGEIDMEKYQELLSSSLIELVRGVGLA